MHDWAKHFALSPSMGEVVTITGGVTATAGAAAGSSTDTAGCVGLSTLS